MFCLKKLGKEPFVYQSGMKNFVRMVEKPFTSEMLYENYDENEKKCYERGDALSAL